MQEFDTATSSTSKIPASVDQQSTARSDRSALLIVFLVMVIDLLGFGIVLPLLPRYGKELLGPLFPGETHARLRGGILGLLMASFSLMQFVFAPIWGRMSDRVGRKPFILLGLMGSVLFYALFGFASDWGTIPGRQTLGLLLLFVARVGAGIAGATVSTAQAVIADCTTQENRSRGMALIGAAFGIGFTFGPVFGFGALTLFPQERGGPGYAAAAFSLIALLLGLQLMPETLRPGTPPRHRGWLNLSGLRTALSTPSVGVLIVTFFLSTLAFASFEPTLALLTQDVLNYGETLNFLVFAYVGLVLALAQGLLYRRLARRGVSEISFMIMGTVLMALGLGGLGVAAALVSAAKASTITVQEGASRATAADQSLLALVLASVSVAVIGFAFVTPSVQALISRRSDPARQGEILGVNQSANALSRILGPMAGVWLYYVHPTHVGPYILSVVLLAVVFLLTLRVGRAPIGVPHPAH
jgi:MFS family permease